MEKILIEVTAPAANLTYDMLIPYNIQIGEMSQLIASVFSQLSNGTYVSTGKNIVCDRATGTTFEPSVFVKDTEIKNGAKLLLF